MPPLIILAATGVALWAGSRIVARVAHNVSAALKRAEEEVRRRAEARTGEPEFSPSGPVNIKELPTLELDPATGMYKLRDERRRG